MKVLLPLMAGALALALPACATTGGETGGGSGPAGECKAEPAQSLVGERATPELGARLLRLTGAKQLRWAPPHTALTMDFRPDRLTVSYDDNYTVERISCG